MEKSIENRIKSIEARLDSIEFVLNKNSTRTYLGNDERGPLPPKRRTIAEVVRGYPFRNGQEKIAAVVGYWEKLEGKSPIKVKDIIQSWRDGKIVGAYHNNFLERAIQDGLVRHVGRDAYDLSQSGEDFFAVVYREQERQSYQENN